MVDLLVYYKELYDKEIEFSERLNGKIGNSIALLTVIGSGHVLLVSEVFPIALSSSIWSMGFMLMCLISVVAFIVAMYRFVKAYSGFKYAYFPIEKMGIAIDLSIAIGERCHDPNTANNHIKEMLITRYRNDAVHNRSVNRVKSKMHYELSKSIIISFCILITTFTIWVLFFRKVQI